MKIDRENILPALAIYFRYDNLRTYFIRAIINQINIFRNMYIGNIMYFTIVIMVLVIIQAEDLFFIFRHWFLANGAICEL